MDIFVKIKKHKIFAQNWPHFFKNFAGGFQPLSFHSPLFCVIALKKTLNKGKASAKEYKFEGKCAIIILCWCDGNVEG